MKFTSFTLCSLLTLFISIHAHAHAEQHPENERTTLTATLAKVLTCQNSEGIASAGDPESDLFLKKAGAVISMDKESDYNEFRYSFIEPLIVNGLPLFSVQQSAGEGGGILIADVKGDLNAFAKQNNLSPASKGETYLGTQNVVFYKHIGKLNTDLPDPDYTTMVAGQSELQKAQGRFFYGCVQPMNLG